MAIEDAFVLGEALAHLGGDGLDAALGAYEAERRPRRRASSSKRASAAAPITSAPPRTCASATWPSTRAGAQPRRRRDQGRMGLPVRRPDLPRPLRPGTRPARRFLSPPFDRALCAGEGTDTHHGRRNLRLTETNMDHASFTEICLHQLRMSGVHEGGALDRLDAGGRTPGLRRRLHGRRAAPRRQDVPHAPARPAADRRMVRGCHRLAAMPDAVEALKNCDMLIDCIFLLFSPEQFAIQAAGTRILTAVEPPALSPACCRTRSCARKSSWRPPCSTRQRSCASRRPMEQTSPTS